MLLDSLPLSVKIWLVQMVAFHLIGLGFHWIDSSGRLARFRVRPLERRTYGQLLPRVVANQVFVLLPAMMAVEWAGLAFVGVPHIPLWLWPVGMIGMTIGHDLVQYATHRYVLHRPLLMRSLGHDVHHTTAAGRSISACYMSLADYFLEIVLPYLLPLMIIGGGGSDWVFHSFVVTAGAFGGLYEHSGYDFGLGFTRARASGWRGRLDAIFAHMLSSKAHGEHHTRGNVSFSDGFGSSNICDTVLKTRWDLVGTRQRQRVRDQQSTGPVQDAVAR